MTLSWNGRASKTLQLSFHQRDKTRVGESSMQIFESEENLPRWAPLDAPHIQHEKLTVVDERTRGKETRG